MLSRFIQAAKGALLIDVIAAVGLSIKYLMRPKATVNYPFERNPQSPRFRGEHGPEALSERGGAVHRLQAVRGDLPVELHHDRGRAPRGRQPADLANGDRWERLIARNLELDAPY